MANNLLNILRRNAPSLLSLPENRMTPLLKRMDTLKNVTLKEFDENVTSKFGGSSPPFPFPTADDYYRWAASHTSLKRVQVPLLALNASDDPVVGHVPTDVGDNGYVAIAVTKGGGHLGWFEYSEDGKSLRRWCTKPVVEWLKVVGDDLVPGPSQAPEIIQDGEWTTEVDRNHLGFKILGEEGEIQGAEAEEGLFAGL